MLEFEDFYQTLKEIGALLTYQDANLIASKYAVDEEKAESAYPSSNLDHIESFRNRKLTGSLRGAAKSNALFGDWLSESTKIGLEGQQTRAGHVVEYIPFVNQLADILERQINQNGGILPAGHSPSRLGWLLKEFDLVDTLISQLEEMKPTVRRRCLISLQYALAAADTHNVSSR